MHFIRTCGLSLFLLLSFGSIAQHRADSIYQPTVLLELFSSEGCSSCPVADEFMQQILHLADSTRSPVFVLDYHVDIWDRSGWKDRYSDSVWTNRQDTYMKHANQLALFTPMLFVNGQHGLPAGAKREVGTAIAMTLARRAPARLTVDASQVKGKPAIDVRYIIEGFADSTQLVFVLAEKEGRSEVTAGENAGKTLVHHHVVRKLKTLPVATRTGTYEFEVAGDTDLKKYLLTVFLQHAGSWKVLATEQINFR